MALMIAMALQVLIAASVCPSSHSTLTQLDATSLMKAALASDCTLTQQRWSAHPRAQFNGEDLFQIRNLVRIQDGIPSTSALSLDLSPKGSRHGHHHLVLRGHTEEHGNLVARIGHVSGSLDSLQEAIAGCQGQGDRPPKGLIKGFIKGNSLISYLINLFN